MEPISEEEVMRIYQANLGESLSHAAANARALAVEHEETVVLVFGGTPVAVWPDYSVDLVCDLWRAVNALQCRVVSQ